MYPKILDTIFSFILTETLKTDRAIKFDPPSLIVFPTQPHIQLVPYETHTGVCKIASFLPSPV